MIQVLDPLPQKETFGGRIGRGLGTGFSQEMANRLKGAQERESQEAKLGGQLAFDQKTYDTIKNRFGEEEADLYLAETEGGKTHHIQKLLEKEERQRKLPKKLGIEEEEEGEEEFEELLPAERTRREDARYKTNLPLYTDAQEKLIASENEQDELNILEDLSPKISGLQRLNINPRTGDLIIPGASSEEAQRYVKTINDFTRNAKESYGARVTNFDLQQFMKRLPTLANSEKARKQIIEQLQLINRINLTRGRALQSVFDQRGGIRKIDYDKALSIANKKSRKEIEKLKSQFTKIGSNLEKEYQNEISEFKKTIPKGRVAVKLADGTFGDIPKDKLKTFLEVEGNEAL